MKAGNLIFTLIGLGALAAGVWFGTSYHSAPTPAIELQSGTRLPTGRPLQPFDLVAADGSAFTLDSLKGQWTFMSFGYTHCPDVCPTMLATFNAMDQKTRHLDQPAKYLFISVDPDRDTPKKLGEYVAYFNKDFLSATGKQENLLNLTRQLGILYAKVDNQDSALGYLVDHSASVLLINPQGQLAAIFSAPHDPAAMSSDYITMTSHNN